MKVNCTKIYNEITKQYQDTSSWITVGKEYVVLEMLVMPGKEVLYRLVGDNEDEMPAIYNARQFKVVKNKIASNWIIEELISGSFIFCPALWRERGFWEKCYDRDSAALEIYKREARIIMEEEGML